VLKIEDKGCVHMRCGRLSHIKRFMIVLLFLNNVQACVHARARTHEFFYNTFSLKCRVHCKIQLKFSR